jgi:tetratricopeptide (TPR) repeat protein
MANKIELYREVLAIEPNSKVFFPLARQLAEEGQVDEAVAALQRGIGFHPDHLEAKFLLIDILTRLGREREAEAVFTDVGALLARYPSVWLLWSRAAAARSRDPSLAMLFLGHYFQNDTLSWSEVMERGLRSLTQATAEAKAGPEDLPGPSLVSAAPEVVAVAPAATEETGAPPLRGAREVMALADLLEAPDGAGPTRGPARTGKPRETPVRTRTMASLLASQGDLTGALNIYNELIEAASGAEREALMAEATALTPASPPAQDAPPVAGPDVADAPREVAPVPKGAAKLINILEALAGRLEARSGV